MSDKEQSTSGHKVPTSQPSTAGEPSKSTEQTTQQPSTEDPRTGTDHTYNLRSTSSRTKVSAAPTDKKQKGLRKEDSVDSEESKEESAVSIATVEEDLSQDSCVGKEGTPSASQPDTPSTSQAADSQPGTPSSSQPDTPAASQVATTSQVGTLADSQPGTPAESAVDADEKDQEDDLPRSPPEPLQTQSPQKKPKLLASAGRGPSQGPDVRKEQGPSQGPDVRKEQGPSQEPDVRKEQGPSQEPDVTAGEESPGRMETSSESAEDETGDSEAPPTEGAPQSLQSETAGDCEHAPPNPEMVDQPVTGSSSSVAAGSAGTSQQPAPSSAAAATRPVHPSDLPLNQSTETTFRRKCSPCKEEFAAFDAYKEHIARHGKQICPKCFGEYDAAQELKEHQPYCPRAEEDDLSFNEIVCKKCNAVLPSVLQMNRHIKQHDADAGQQVDEDDTVDPENDFNICKYCGEECESPGTLLEHYDNCNRKFGAPLADTRRTARTDTDGHFP